MKRQTRIGLIFAGGALAALSSYFAVAHPGHPPITPPTASAIPGVSADVPFELFRGSRIVLSGKINGVETSMMLDSGAGITTLDRKFAQRIGLKSGTAVTAQGSGGTDQGELVTGATIEAGNLRLSDATVMVIDLAHIEKAVGRPIPVVLGREVFMNSVVGLDFEKQLLTLSPSQGFVAPRGATEVKLRREGTAHFLPLSVDGLPPVEAALDLGNGGALSVSKEYLDGAPQLMALPYAVSLAGGVGGLFETRRVTLPKVELAGFAFTKVPADLGSIRGGPYKGRVNAGIQLFRPFRLTLDLGNDRLWLQRTRAAVVFPKDRAGLFLTLDGDHFNVLHVSPGSPADHAGFKKGDTLVAIGGERVGPAFYSSRFGSWSRSAAGTQVALTKGDGQTVRLTLADYY